MDNARYLLTAPAYVEGSKEHPAVVEFPESVAPSRTWAPLNPPAQRALKRLGITREITVEAATTKSEPADDTFTMGDWQKAQRGKIVGES